MSLVVTLLLKGLVEESMKEAKPDRIARFSMLFRGLIIRITMEEDPERTLELMRQGLEIVQMSEAVRGRDLLVTKFSIQRTRSPG